MGFWDWFRSTPSPPATVADRVYLTTSAKLAAMATEVAVGPGRALVVANFPGTLREVEQAFAGVGYPGERLGGPTTSEEVLARRRPEGRPTPTFALVSQLAKGGVPPDLTGDTPVRVLVSERHFLRTHDELIIQFAKRLSQPRVTFFVSMEEPLMRAFAGPWVADVLRRLGMQETDAVESKMVVRRIAQAQAKYAKVAEVDEPAESAEEWATRSGIR